MTTLTSKVHRGARRTRATGRPARNRTRTRARALAVVAAVAVTTAIWSAVTGAFGVDLVSPAFPGAAPSARIGLPAVIAFSALAALAAWALLAALERWTARARMSWLITAIAVFVLSLGGPLSGTGVTVADRCLLALLHLAVAAVIIPWMYRSSRPTGDLETEAGR